MGERSGLKTVRIGGQQVPLVGVTGRRGTGALTRAQRATGPVRTNAATVGRGGAVRRVQRGSFAFPGRERGRRGG